MELRNYDDNIMNSNSDFSTNYQGGNQYPGIQSPINGPPIQQNQSTMPIISGNQNPPQNYPQQVIPTFQPPFGVEQNISQIKHNKITQPQKNIISIKNHSKIPIIVLLIIGIIFLSTSIFLFSNIKFIVLALFSSIFGLIAFIGAIRKMFSLDYYIIEFILSESSLTVVKKAILCRRDNKIYQKADISRFDFTKTRREKRKGSYYHTYEIILVFKNGNIEKIFSNTVIGETFYEEERNYVLYYINNYLNR